MVAIKPFAWSMSHNPARPRLSLVNTMLPSSKLLSYLFFFHYDAFPKRKDLVEVVCSGSLNEEII